MVTFYNPHVDDFLGEPPHFRFLNRRPLKKYGFVLDQAQESGHPIRVLVDATISAFVPERIFQRLPSFARRAIASLEYSAWLRMNGLKGKVDRAPSPEAPIDDVLFAFSYKAATGNFELRKRTMSHYRAVIFHLSHYFVGTGEKSNNIRQIENVWLAGDSDIENNFYFKKFFSWYEKKIIVLPFSVKPRFKVTKSWSDRENLCIATGSFHYLALEKPEYKYLDFMEQTGHSTYHPIRRAIHDSADQIGGTIFPKTSPYRSYEKKTHFKSILKNMDISQKSYFSLDLVDLYNSYRYAIVGEELSGFPALGAFEAMACGCTLFAVMGHYEGLGLIPGEHYLEYDGTLSGLVSAVDTAQQSRVGASVADAGRDLVRDNFNPSQVYNKWMRGIEYIKTSSPS